MKVTKTIKESMADATSWTGEKEKLPEEQKEPKWLGISKRQIAIGDVVRECDLDTNPLHKP